MSRDQVPAGGCGHCGAVVRWRKSGDWVCHKCHRVLYGRASQAA